jgi:hypothetical protein
MEIDYLVLKRASASRTSGEAHHEDRMPTRGYAATREGCDGGVREELAAGISRVLTNAQIAAALLWAIHMG